MKPTTEILANLSKNSKENKEEVFTRLYRYLLREDIYYVAYKNLYANGGAGTKGVNKPNEFGSDTADGFSEAKIANIVKSLAEETFMPTPFRRTYIAKQNNPAKKRPLGIPTFTDKLVQEVIRMILEVVYEPLFLECSHGFRPKRGCHTALKSLKKEMNGARWFVEGDIKGCFDNIDHSILAGLGDGKPLTSRDRLRELIDSVLPVGKDYDSFIVAMEAAGVEVKRGKQLSFRLPGGKKFMRQDTIGEEYSYEAILERISGRRIAAPSKKVNLLIDIQSKMQQGYSEGVRKWAKLQNLKDMAKTLIYLQENDLDDYGLLAKTTSESVQRYNDLSGRTKSNESRMKEIAVLQKHIGSYKRTKDIYQQYRKSGWSKKFYETHESDIIIHKAAKKAFDELGLKNLPSMQNLIQEYAMLAAENKKLYPEQKLARQKMIELLTAKNNTDMILGVPKQKRREHETANSRQ